MKRNESFDIYIDNHYEIKKLDKSYQEEYQRLFTYLCHQENDHLQINLYGCALLEKLKQAQEKGINADKVFLKDNAKALKQLDKEINKKDLFKKIVMKDYEKYTVSSIWFVFTCFIVLLFFKSWISEAYLVSYSIDILVAIVAALVAFRSERIKQKIINRYNFSTKYITLDILTMIFCIIIKMMITSPFDITFLILVIVYFMTQRKIKQEFEMKVNG